jgi:hypothetical protein
MQQAEAALRARISTLENEKAEILNRVGASANGLREAVREYEEAEANLVKARDAHVNAASAKSLARAGFSFISGKSSLLEGALAKLRSIESLQSNGVKANVPAATVSSVSVPVSAPAPIPSIRAPVVPAPVPVPVPAVVPSPVAAPVPAPVPASASWGDDDAFATITPTPNSVPVSSSASHSLFPPLNPPLSTDYPISTHAVASSSFQAEFQSSEIDSFAPSTTTVTNLSIDENFGGGPAVADTIAADSWGISAPTVAPIKDDFSDFSAFPAPAPATSSAANQNDWGF